MAFLGGLGALAGLVQGYAEQQQRQQQQQSEMLRQRQAMMQLQEIQRQRQQQQNIAPILRGLAGSGALNLAPLAALPQGTGGGGGMPGGGMSNPSPGPTNLMAPMSADQAAAMVPIINQRESGNQNILNRQGPGGTPASSAAGYAQELTGTWQEDAPKAGVDIKQYPTAISATKPIQDQVTKWQLQNKGVQPWATRSGNLHGSFAPGATKATYDQMEQNGVNPPQIPPPPGGFDIATLAHAIEKTNPGIDDETFVAALDSASALMSRGTQQQWKQYQQIREAQQGQQRLDIEQSGVNERERHDKAMEARPVGREPAAEKPPKFGSPDDLMQRWHQDFVTKNKREPTTDEIAAQHGTFSQEAKPIAGRTQQMDTRLMIGANQVSKAVTAMTHLPAGTTLGIFGGAQAAMGEGLGENVRKGLANAVTPQAAQILKTITNGVSRGLATLEAGGAAQGIVGLSKLLMADLPATGDTGLTIAGKYADIRQIVESATEVLSTQDLPKDQKALLQSIDAQIKKAVPFSLSDVAELASDPSDEKLADFAKRVGLGKPQEGEISAAPSGVPAGAEYSPSRKQWRDSSGKLYDAQGKPL